MPLLTALSWSHGVSRLLSMYSSCSAYVASLVRGDLAPGQIQARARTRLRVLVQSTLCAVLVSGCGPFGYISKVSRKTVAAVQKAEEAQAQTYAPYEYWAAKAYLERARVMMSYSEYERAFDYGSRAQQLAEAATRKAERVKQEEAQKASAASANRQGGAQ